MKINMIYRLMMTELFVNPCVANKYSLIFFSFSFLYLLSFYKQIANQSQIKVKKSKDYG